jgi:hypothetical protein
VFHYWWFSSSTQLLQRDQLAASAGQNTFTFLQPKQGIDSNMWHLKILDLNVVCKLHWIQGHSGWTTFCCTAFTMLWSIKKIYCNIPIAHYDGLTWELSSRWKQVYNREHVQYFSETLLCKSITGVSYEWYRMVQFCISSFIKNVFLRIVLYKSVNHLLQCNYPQTRHITWRNEPVINTRSKKKI